jgi:hypothetical protein
MRYRWRHRQGGATFLGILTIVSILGLAAYSGIRLIPKYLDYLAIVKSMEQVAGQFKGAPPTPGEVRSALQARWTVEYISDLDPKDIEVTKVPNGLEMRAYYEARAPFIGNISFIVEFDKSVTITGGREF